MLVRERLSELRKLNAAIDNLEQAKRGAFAQCTSGISQLRDVPISGGSTKRPVEAYAEMSAEVDRMTDELCEKRADCRALLTQLPNPLHRQLLTLYYVDGMTWQQITDRISMGGNRYSTNYVRMKLHRQALHETTIYCGNA